MVGGMNDDQTARIVAFIAERLNDDQRMADAATPGPWRYNPAKQWLDEPDKARRDLLALVGVQGEEFVGAGPAGKPIGVAATGPADDPQSMADAAHIARHDPDRVLRGVEAKRAILDRYAGACAEVRSFVTAERRTAARIAQFELEAVVHLLALAWAAHPDYDPAWSPNG
jgi:hypothetical protein